MEAATSRQSTIILVVNLTRHEIEAACDEIHCTNTNLGTYTLAQEPLVAKSPEFAQG